MPAAKTAKADIGPEANDCPLKTPARVRLPQPNDVI